jgi:hypothetical protein
MKLLRPTLSAVTALAFLLQTPGIANAQEAPRPLPGITPQALEPPAVPSGPSASRDGRSDGLTLIILGAVGLGAGLAMTFYGFSQTQSSICPTCNGNTDAEVAGIGLSTVGVFGMVVGIVVMANAGTRHETKTSYVLPVPTLAPMGTTATGERAETAWVRAPMWSEAGRDAAVGGPMKGGVTLFAQSF